MRKRARPVVALSSFSATGGALLERPLQELTGFGIAEAELAYEVNGTEYCDGELNAGQASSKKIYLITPERQEQEYTPNESRSRIRRTQMDSMPNNRPLTTTLSRTKELCAISSA